MLTPHRKSETLHLKLPSINIFEGSTIWDVHIVARWFSATKTEMSQRHRSIWQMAQGKLYTFTGIKTKSLQTMEARKITNNAYNTAKKKLTLAVHSTHSTKCYQTESK